MPVETATYISQLNSANPVATDGVVDGDNHMRLIKATLKATFPNFTAAALSASQAKIDSTVDAVTDGTVRHENGTVAAPGMSFKSDLDTGWFRSGPNAIKGAVGGNEFVAIESDKSVAFRGTVTSDVGFIGPGTTPVGAILIWPSNSLPSPTYGEYEWCAGTTVSRATYSELFAKLGTNFGTGNGTTTFNLPDLRDSVPVGKASMGGSASAGRITTGVTGFTSSTLGERFGSDQHTLNLSQLPDVEVHTTLDWRHTHFLAKNVTTNNLLADDNYIGKERDQADEDINYALRGSTQVADIGLSSQSGANSTLDIQLGSGAKHNNVQPSLVCNYIIRIK